MTSYEKTQATLDDWRKIAGYTRDNYGEAQTRKYMASLLKCIEATAKGTGVYKDKQMGSRKIRIKHCQKHYIFSLVQKNKPLLVLAIFHEKMDLMTRLKNRLR